MENIAKECCTNHKATDGFKRLLYQHFAVYTQWNNNQNLEVITHKW